MARISFAKISSFHTENLSSYLLFEHLKSWIISSMFSTSVMWRTHLQLIDLCNSKFNVSKIKVYFVIFSWNWCVVDNWTNFSPFGICDEIYQWFVIITMQRIQVLTVCAVFFQRFINQLLCFFTSLELGFCIYITI